VTLIEFNRDFPTPLSELADVCVPGNAAEQFPVFVQRLLERQQRKE